MNRLWESKELYTNDTIKILENKVEFNKFCNDNNIRIPVFSAYNKNFFCW